VRPFLFAGRGLATRAAAAAAPGVLAVFFAFPSTAQNPAPEGGWDPVDRILEQVGKDLPGGVRKYSWPRTDMHVVMHGVALEPALALGSWAAFQATGNGDETTAVGDLVLLGAEVNPVVAELHANGIEISAIHNHLIEETPRVSYVHFHARGEAAALARGIRATLNKTRTPTGAGASRLGPTPAEAQPSVFQTIQNVLGRRGAFSGRVLQIGVARAGAVQDSGMELPPSMGAATTLNFQAAGARVATAGDFVLLADEVNPVIRELQAGGISVTALHSHMMREEPRLFFLHFWGVGPAEKIAETLRAALARTASRP